MRKPVPATNDRESLSSAQLHDALREIRDKEGAFDDIAELVRYLRIERGEKPSLLHYEALLRTNVDAEHGEAGAVRRLLEEVREKGLVPDSELLHSALLVRIRNILRYKWQSTRPVDLGRNCGGTWLIFSVM